MAMAPAAISAMPAVTMMCPDATAPDRPAASAKGTVKPSAMPITTSRTVSEARKWRSVWSMLGMGGIHQLGRGGASAAALPTASTKRRHDGGGKGLAEKPVDVG